MMDTEEKQETGATLMFLGFGIWMMDFLVAFFLPSGIAYGHRAAFLGIIAAMGVLGLVVLLTGFKVRGRSSTE
jgi:NO-binding membrane sensor protein with MHYT domain